MEIRTKRLLLKPLGMQYFDEVNEYALDIENTKYMMFLPNESAEETREFLKSVEKEWQSPNQFNYEFAILLEEKMVGGVSLTLDVENRQVGELGWIVNKKYWQQGIASEAAVALVDYFRKNLGVKHFVAHCDAGNPGSYKTMEKIGMVKTAEYGGRKNKSSDEERMEYQYEMTCSN